MWRGETDPGLATPVGEIGELVTASIIKLQSDPDPCLRILIRHEGKRFFGDFRTDNPQLLNRVREVLVSKIGAPLVRMGDLEIGE